MIELSLVQKVAVAALPILFAITVHEVAHGWVAKQFGDNTAANQGRLTLNPLKHIDLVGTVIVPIVMVMFSPFIFGWAKPVPVVKQNLRNPKRDMAIVALAGPVANLLMLIAWALLLRVIVELGGVSGMMGYFFILACVAGISINSVLMLLNLLPLPPLDGGRIVAGILPSPLSEKYESIERFGLIILVALMLAGVLGIVLAPALVFCLNLFSAVAGISYIEFLGLSHTLYGS